MTRFPAARSVQLTPFVTPEGEIEAGIQLAVHEAGAGPAVVLCHGFPELAFSWRHQLPALAEAGFHAIAPNQRGYPGSSAPQEIERYDMAHLTHDLVSLLDALEIERAIFVGHDWGGFVAWAMPILHPHRTAGVIGVNTPYVARLPQLPTELMSSVVGGRSEDLYLLWFQEPGIAEGVLDRHPRLVFEKLLRKVWPEETGSRRRLQDSLPPDMNPFRHLEKIDSVGEALLDEEELNHYVESFATCGFRGGLNWYRNFDRNWTLWPQVGKAKIPHPCLMITAQHDPILPPTMAEGMEDRVEDLKTVMIEDCGHWTQQEKPEELNRIMIDWLKRLF